MENKILGINQTCNLIGISKNTYYHSKDPYITLDIKYKSLKLKIIKIIRENPSYGYPRIKTALEKIYNEHINHKLLLKLLKIWRLSLKRNIKRHKKKWISDILDYLGKKSNLLRTLLKNNIKIECLMVMLSDFTEIYYSGHKAYLCVHMDYAGKYILGWELSSKSDTLLVMSSVKKAIKSLQKFNIKEFKNIISHQDRGTVYTSNEYVSFIIKCDMKLSYSRKGEPGDNAVNESFFSRLKEEWRDVFYEKKDFIELRKEIKKAIDYYNKKRYHSSIGYKTPLAYILNHFQT